MAQEKKALTVADTLTEAQKEVIEMGRPMKLKYNAKGSCRGCKAFKTLMKKGALRKPCSVCELGNRCAPADTKFQKTHGGTIVNVPAETSKVENTPVLHQSN